MVNPDAQPGPARLVLSAESQEQSRAAAARLGYGPDTLQKRIQEMMLDPEATRKKNAEHAKKMGIDPVAILKRWELEAKSSMPVVARPPGWVTEQQEISALSSPETWFSPAEPSSPDAVTSEHVRSRLVCDTDSVISSSPGASPTQSSTPAALTESVATPEDKSTIVASSTSAKPPNAGTQSSPKKRKRTTQEKPQVKGEPARKKPNMAKIPKKSGSKSVSPATDVAAESSKTSTAREAVKDCTPSLFVSQVDKYPTLGLPKWHTDLSLSSRFIVDLAKRGPPELKALQGLKNCIDRCEGKVKLLKPTKISTLVDELRNHVHKAEFLPNITKFVIKKTYILVSENGLPRIFAEEANFPPDLKADAYQLYLRWMRGEFSRDILRGITTIMGGDRTSDRLEQAYRSRNPTHARFYGDEGLVLGQCWPTQLCTVRDGAHGSTQGGIYGEREKGAYSIVVSGGGYHDKDEGDIIEYSGTEGKNFTPTESTQHMIRSATLGNPIRVIRSHQLNKKNQYRPKHGLRYDGLYTVKSFVIVDNEKQIHRFRLERCPDQHPIRFGDGPSGRPTIYEVSAYEKIKA
jgi:hypothetical protein